MKIAIYSASFPLSPFNVEHIQHRFEKALGRFSQAIAEVRISIIDINGPRGGEDKRCLARVRMRPRGLVVVSDDSGDFVALVTQVADRAAHAVARRLDKNRSRTKSRSSHPRVRDRLQVNELSER